ncbi:MAG: globin domain-containing protein [Pseudomonadota bacterium]
MSNESERIRKTWAQVSALPDDFARIFYANLFRIDPSTKPLFVGDLELQGRKLVQTLGFIVDNIDSAETLMPAAQDLAIRHVAYGVTAAQYPSVGTAIVNSMQQILGEQFSIKDRDAWVETYDGLADAMIAAAYPA